MVSRARRRRSRRVRCVVRGWQRSRRGGGGSYRVLQVEPRAGRYERGDDALVVVLRGEHERRLAVL